MKFLTHTKIMLLLVIFSFLIYSCKETDITKPCVDPFCGCPPPQMGIDGVKLPYKYYSKPKSSFSRNKLAFFETGVLLNIWDKNTNSIIQINTTNLISAPSEILKIIDISWCPYDDNKIAMLCGIRTDTSTSNNIKKYVSGKKVFLYNIKEKSISDISPPIFGSYGYPVNPKKFTVNYLLWLPKSILNNDSIYFPELGLYHLQSDFFDSTYYSNYFFYEISKLCKYRIRMITDFTTAVNGLNINGMNYYFSEKLKDMSFISISPNEEKLALCVNPMDTAKLAENIRWKEIWIFNIKDIVENNPYKNLKIINLRRDFCKYAFIGLNAEFITNNSLAVSMNSDGDDIAPLFEVSLDGKIIRQITDK